MKTVAASLTSKKITSHVNESTIEDGGLNEVTIDR